MVYFLGEEVRSLLQSSLEVVTEYSIDCHTMSKPFHSGHIGHHLENKSLLQYHIYLLLQPLETFLKNIVVLLQHLVVLLQHLDTFLKILVLLF